MEPQQYMQVLKKSWLLVLIITLTVVSTSTVISYFVITPTYKSDISVIIGKVDNSTDNKDQTVSYDQLVIYQMLVKTYSELAKSRTVSENVINKLKLDMKPEILQNMISVSPKGDTEFLTLSVKSNNAEQAMLIANQLAASLKEVSISVKKMDNIQILDPAQLPTAPDSPKPIFNMAIAFFLGLIIGVGGAFLLDYLDNTVKTQEDVEKLLGVSVIGIIPYDLEAR